MNAVEKYFEEKFGVLSDNEGQALNPGNFGDAKLFAKELGNLIYRLHKLDTKGAPVPSFENAFAGSDLEFFEAEYEDLLATYKRLLPVEFVNEKYIKATKSPWKKDAVLIHGDLVPANILMSDGKIKGIKAADKAVAGDPAIDLIIAWDLFDKKARKIFFNAADADKDTIERARILALRHAAKNYFSKDLDETIMARDALTEIMKDYEFSGGVDGYDGGDSEQPDILAQ